MFDRFRRLLRIEPTEFVLFRNLFTLRINAAARPLGFSYSKLIGALKKKNVTLDRKSLSTLAKDYPEVFEKLVKELA